MQVHSSIFRGDFSLSLEIPISDASGASERYLDLVAVDRSSIAGNRERVRGEPFERLDRLESGPEDGGS
jgi:hypothetical protein